MNSSSQTGASESWLRTHRQRMGRHQAVLTGQVASTSTGRSATLSRNLATWPLSSQQICQPSWSDGLRWGSV